MENMKIWDALRTPPADSLKKIGGGRLSGMTDINPQWRMQAMTEQFGPIGIGWTYRIKELWTLPGADGQVCAFSSIRLKFKLDGEWSEEIPGVGGSMLIVQESAGLHTSDEAFKMATTDALSVAMKQIGVAADIYLGHNNESKYSNPSGSKGSAKKATVKQIAYMDKQITSSGKSADCFTAIKEKFGTDKLEEIGIGDVTEVLDMIKAI